MRRRPVARLFTVRGEEGHAGGIAIKVSGISAYIHYNVVQHCPKGRNQRQLALSASVKGSTVGLIYDNWGPRRRLLRVASRTVKALVEQKM